MDGGFLFIFLLIAVGGIAYSIYHSQQVGDAWTEAARVLKLLYAPGGFTQERKLTGKIDGHTVMVETFTRGSGKNSTKCTRYNIGYPQILRLGL